uniref:Small ribosomal subunit protein eS21 n=1 Tax=Vombatus ursinus TaxID=29139 RepID=A0A4X2LQT9_VOMUR
MHGEREKGKGEGKNTLQLPRESERGGEREGIQAQRADSVLRRRVVARKCLLRPRLQPLLVVLGEAPPPFSLPPLSRLHSVRVFSAPPRALYPPPPASSAVISQIQGRATVRGWDSAVGQAPGLAGSVRAGRNQSSWSVREGGRAGGPKTGSVLTPSRRSLPSAGHSASDMQNDAGEFVDLYVPRKCSASNRIIGAKDHASIQMNVAEVDKVTGRFNGQFKTYAICGAIRRMGESDDSILRLAKNDGIVSKATEDHQGD